MQSQSWVSYKKGLKRGTPVSVENHLKSIQQFLRWFLWTGTSKLFLFSFPKLRNGCFPLCADFGILLCASPSASQMSEVKHVISRVSLRLLLCSITWYLLRRLVNKHRSTATCGWSHSLNAEVPWWVQFLPPQRMNLSRWRNVSVQDNEKDSYIQVCGEVISAGWELFLC